MKLLVMYFSPAYYFFLSFFPSLLFKHSSLLLIYTPLIARSSLCKDPLPWRQRDRSSAWRQPHPEVNDSLRLFSSQVKQKWKFTPTSRTSPLPSA
jgi:hypothetical protein